MECLSYQIPISNQRDFENIITASASLSYLKSFNFSAILAAIYDPSQPATINFLLLQKIYPTPILTLFDHCEIPYFRSHNTLLFDASPTKIEEALLTSTDLSISVPPSFLSATKRIAFEYRENSLHVRLLKVSDIGVL